MNSNMNSNMNSDTAVTKKVLQEFLDSPKRVGRSIGDWGSKYQSIINSLVNSLFFAIKNAFGSISKLTKNLLSGETQIKLAGLQKIHREFVHLGKSERGDVPGWVLVVLMTTGLVTGIWTVAQPRLSSILKNSLDNMNSIR
jgi:hypothetical protein